MARTYRRVRIRRRRHNYSFLSAVTVRLLLPPAQSVEALPVSEAGRGQGNSCGPSIKCGLHGVLRFLARRVEVQRELLERRQRPTAQGGGERGAAGVGDLVVVEVQQLERLERACGGLRQLPKLERLYLYGNQITDQGVVSLLLVAPPTAGVLPSLHTLDLSSNQITDEGCAALASALRGGALPALKDLFLDDNPASWEAQQEAACEVPQARGQVLG